MIGIWKCLVVAVCVFLSVDCRRIHENGLDKNAVRKTVKETQESIKDHGTIDLDNCTDCDPAINKHDNTKSKKKSSDKKSDFSAINVEEEKSKKRIKSATHHPKPIQKKNAKKHNTKRTHRQRKEKQPRRKLSPDAMVPDATNNASQDRWRKQKLNQLPGVARLEQRLHPTVRNPIHSLRMSMHRILQIMKDSVRRVDVDHKFMFNATRYDIMMNVRKELMNIADGNDKAYDAVLQASLLTKDIYRRAHRERLLGPRTIPAGVSSDTTPKLRTIPLREQYLLAQEELQRANRLKHRIAVADRERYELETQLMQVQRQVEGSLPARTLKDLNRISNQTLRVLQTFSPTFGSGGRIHLYGHMYKNSIENVRESRDLMHDAKNILTQAKSQITMGRSLKHQIERRARDGSTGTVSDMPFNDNRMMLWAVVDSARLHAEKLAKTAADIHMKITPILQKAQEVLADKDKNTISRRIEETAKTLEHQIMTLVTTLDKICVAVDNEDILRSRCEAKQTFDQRFYVKDDEIIDCDVYITDGSGDDLEGSGDLLDTDVLIPKTRITESVDKSHIAFNETKKDVVILSKENVTIKGVTRTTDDEDILSKKPKPELTTTAMPTSTEPLFEDLSPNDTEDDDFTFTDWFGLLGDDPMAGGSSKNKLNAIILERLSVYSKYSVNVFATTDKTKEALEDLQTEWNKTKLSFEGFENSILSTKVFLHKWAAKRLYFDAVHDRVISLKDHVDLQSEVIEKQCSEAIAVAERKLEAAEERQTRDQNRAENAADPEIVKEAVDAVNSVTGAVKEIVQLKKVNPDPCGSIQSLDNALRKNISELRQKIEKVKLIASSLQVPVSLQSDSYLTLPLERDDTKTTGMTLSMNVKPGGKDGPIALVNTEESGSLVVSVNDNGPVLTVLDDGDYSIGEMTLDLQFESNKTYDISVERLGSLFSMFVYSILDNSLLANNSILVDSVDLYQEKPSTLYLAGAPENFPTFGTGSWQGCLSHVSINGRYLSLLGKDSVGNMTGVCSDMSLRSEKESLVLGGAGYARLSMEPLSSLSRGAMDNIMIQFKAYTDGVLVFLTSSSTRSLESVEIDRGRIIVAFRNHYGQALLQSKEGVFSYGRENILQITVKVKRQMELDLSVNGDSDSFEKIEKPSVVEEIKDTAFYIGGLPSSVNRSLSGCIQKLLLNEEDATFSLAEESLDVYRGPCEETNCIKFVEESLPINLGESTKRNTLIFSFSYGSKGNIIEYSKEEKLKLTISVDSDGLDIYEAVGDASDSLNLGNHSDGEVTTVTLKATSDTVEITADGTSKEVSYDSGCGWLGCLGSEEDKKYSIIVGGSSDDTANFEGNLIEFFMNGRSFDTKPFMESNNLQRCAPPRKHRKPVVVGQDAIGRTVC